MREEETKTGRPWPPCLLMGSRLNLAILAQLGIETKPRQQAGEGQQPPDGGGGAAARIPQHKADEQVAKERHAAPGAGIEAVVAAELLRGGVAGQLGGEEREAEDGAQGKQGHLRQHACRRPGCQQGQGQVAQAHHAYPQPHGERYSQAALHQAGGWELEQNADHRREGEDAAEQVGGVRQALDMGGEGEVELVEQDLVAACQQGEPHEGALAHYLPPLAQDGATGALVAHRAFGQHPVLQHSEQGEEARRQDPRQGIALLGQGEADQGAEQHARLAGQIVQGEGALTLARVVAFAGKVGLGAGGEQGPRKAGEGGGQQQDGQGLGPAQQHEA